MQYKENIKLKTQNMNIFFQQKKKGKHEQKLSCKYYSFDNLQVFFQNILMLKVKLFTNFLTSLQLFIIQKNE